MENEVKTVGNNALAVSYKVGDEDITLTKDIVKRYLVGDNANVTDKEIFMFMNLCKAQKLNPFINECYLVKYQGKPAQLIPSKAAFQRRAFENPDYLGKEDGIIVRRGKEIVKKEGNCVYPGEDLLGGWCKVHYLRRDREQTSYKEVSMKEFDKGIANWKTMPSLMINKVAISQCLREAFPKDYEGLYSKEEMIASGCIPAEYTVKEDENDTEQVLSKDDTDPIISQEQRKNLFATAQAKLGKEDGNNTIKNIISQLGLTSTTEMTVSQYDEAMVKLTSAVENDKENFNVYKVDDTEFVRPNQ